MAGKKKWIQKAIKRPNRVHKYIARVYGNKAFKRNGTIKMQYLNQAIERAKRERNISLLRALVLAKRLKRMHK